MNPKFDITWQQAGLVLLRHNILTNQISVLTVAIIALIVWLSSYLLNLHPDWWQLLSRFWVPLLTIFIIYHFCIINLVVLKLIFPKQFKHFRLAIIECQEEKHEINYRDH
ncbi:MAG: hypothetical protein Tsb005_18180 [Gammaproteobacteria bacterium]